jgi:positive phototaxis protein PixI
MVVPQGTANSEGVLQFQVGRGQHALLPVAYVMELLSVPVASILPVPHVPDYVLGTYQWSGEALWLVDLGAMLGLECLELGEEAVFLVLQVGGQRLGLGVQAVGDMVAVDYQNLRSPTTLFSGRLSPFLNGFWLGAHHEVHLFLNAEAIVRSEMFLTPAAVVLE